MSPTREIPRRDHPLLPVARAYTNYFTPSVEGLENLPATGPALVVGNHSSIYWCPEVWVTFLAMLERRAADQPCFGLAHEVLLKAPVLGEALRQFGVLPAAPEAAEGGLKDGGAVMVYPGGDWEACRPWTERAKVDFAGRKGFIRLALKAGVPVVPAVASGGHDSIFILDRGAKIAEVLRLNSLVRAKVFPITVGLPFGVAPIVPQIPLPTTVAVSFLPPLTWSTEPGDPDDDAFVDACFDTTLDAMQTEMDRLRAEIPDPLRTGVRNHLAGLPGPLAGLANLLS
ncbi:MAG: acyltransferase family protein [Mycobacteriaceae bacterium]|nr:acyltransferase family protein [Mycobacteriaceae bacterium]